MRSHNPAPTSPLEARTGFRFVLLAGLALGLAAVSAHAQTAITGWTLSSTDATNGTAYTSPGPVTFQNTTNAITSFSYGSNTGKAADLATAAYIRRSGVTGSSANNANFWEIQNTSSTDLRGLNPEGVDDTLGNSDDLTLASILMNNNALMGANDVFTNTGGSPTVANNNIERIDYYFAGGFKAVTTDGFAVFERFASGQADGFQIAVFTGWDSINNKPTTYSGNVVEVATANYGAQLDWDPSATTQTTFNYSILRFSNTGDTINTSLNAINTGSSQGVGGVFISLANLGIATGTTIYGYSIMATDTNNTVANLADWTNSTYYPQNTVDTVGTGGSLDLLAFGGRRIVPEPATYGAMFLGLMLAGLGWRRRRLSARAA